MYPGDADDNGIVTLKDFFITAASYLNTGSMRNETGITWRAYTAPVIWSNILFHNTGNVNMYQVDANGDGQIDLFDVAATLVNRGKTR